MPSKLFDGEETGDEPPVEHDLADDLSDPSAPETIGPPTRAGVLELAPFEPYDIQVPTGRRALNDAVVKELMTSIQQIGLQVPPTVRWGVDADQFPCVYLVAGYHRLRAVQLLRYGLVMCSVFRGSEAEARMWEIAENVHRHELTVLERDILIREWVRLAKDRRPQQPAQVAPPVRKHGHVQQAPSVNAAARELGLERTEVQRAVKIASIAPEAQEAAKEAGIDDNQAALGRVAAEPTLPLQMEAVQREKAKTPAPAKAATEPKERDGLKALLKAWKLATHEERDAFRVEIGAVLPSLEDTNADAQEQED